jgi:predicted acyltransferase
MKPEPSQRLLSLDVFRGLTIAGMILVNSPGNDAHYWPLDHAEWNGLTPTDLVFPFFVFIAGISVVFSLSKKLESGASRASLFAQVLKRTVIIFGLGLLLIGFPHYDLSSIRILGVLQRIALCYLFSAIFFLWTTMAVQIGTIIAILLGYAWLMTHLQVSGFPMGDLTKEGNFAAYIDRAILAGHMYRPVYDPEGILSTLPAIATGLFGNLMGFWLRAPGALARKATGSFQAGLVFLLAGWKWGQYFPINKALWTSSYVLVTTGWALVIFGFCYWLIEIQGWKRWSKPFEVFGTNAIAAYFLHVFFLKVQNHIPMPHLDGSPGNLRFFITEHLFSPWLSPQNASLAYAMSYTLLWLGVFSILYRKRIFIKI